MRDKQAKKATVKLHGKKIKYKVDTYYYFKLWFVESYVCISHFIPDHGNKAKPFRIILQVNGKEINVMYYITL